MVYVYINNILMKRIRFIALILLLFSTNISAEPTPRTFETKIAVIDVEYILEKSDVMQSIRVQINDISNQIQDEMSHKERALKNTEAQLVEKRGTIPEEAFEKMIVDFNKNVSEAQKLTQQKKSALERAHSDALSIMHQHIINIISSLAKKSNFNLVLPTSTVIYADNDLNITLEVLTELNNTLRHLEIDYKK